MNIIIISTSFVKTVGQFKVNIKKKTICNIICIIIHIQLGQNYEAWETVYYKTII